MGAQNNNNNERKNYYGIAYGKLSTKVKEVNEEHLEIDSSELKSKTKSVQDIDLRNRFVKKTGDFPYQVFYDEITGNILSFERDDFDKGVSFKLTLLDNEGDQSIVQSKFYSKYTENLLNRLVNAVDINSIFRFIPYSIPNEAEIEGKKTSFYNQGVSVQEAGNKVEMKYRGENSGMPDTERVFDAQGQKVTSRVKRINFLFEEFSRKFSALNSSDTNGAQPSQPAQNVEAKQPAQNVPAAMVNTVDDDDDDLPF